MKKRKKRQKASKITSLKTLRKRSKKVSPTNMISMGKSPVPGDSIQTYMYKGVTIGIWEKDGEYIIGLSYKTKMVKNKETGARSTKSKPFEELGRTKDKDEAKKLFDSLRIIKFGD